MLSHEDAITRLAAPEVFHVVGGTAKYLVIVHDGAASCTCPARAGCWHISTVMARSPFDGLLGIAADRRELDKREGELVANLRADGKSWHTIALALDQTSEGVRKRHKDRAAGTASPTKEAASP